MSRGKDEKHSGPATHSGANAREWRKPSSQTVGQPQRRFVQTLANTASALYLSTACERALVSAVPIAETGGNAGSLPRGPSAVWTVLWLDELFAAVSCLIASWQSDMSRTNSFGSSATNGAMLSVPTLALRCLIIILAHEFDRRDKRLRRPLDPRGIIASDSIPSR